MTATIATEEQHATAVIAAVNAQAAFVFAYDFDDAPAALPQYYALITVTRRFGGPMRFGGDKTQDLYRITTTCVGRTITAVRQVRELVGGIERLSLTVNGRASTPIEFETSTPIGEDDKFYSGVSTWTYALA